MRQQRLRSLSLGEIAGDLRRLDHQRRLDQQSTAWLAAVLRAYDERLRLACSQFGVQEFLESLTGMDREIERVRVEGILQSRSAFGAASTVATIEARPQVEEKPGRAPSDDSKLPAAAAKLVELAVLLLPAADRARYCEEFRSELGELAETGATPEEQLIYGVRLLGQIWALRRELRSPEEPPG